MRRTDLPPRRVGVFAAAARWHAGLQRAYQRLAERSVADYALIQCRMHWKAWSAYR